MIPASAMAPAMMAIPRLRGVANMGLAGPVENSSTPTAPETPMKLVSAPWAATDTSASPMATMLLAIPLQKFTPKCKDLEVGAQPPWPPGLFEPAAVKETIVVVNEA